MVKPSLAPLGCSPNSRAEHVVLRGHVLEGKPITHTYGRTGQQCRAGRGDAIGDCPQVVGLVIGISGRRNNVMVPLASWLLVSTSWSPPSHPPAKAMKNYQFTIIVFYLSMIALRA